MAFFLCASASSAKGTLQSSREKRTHSADTPHHYARAPKSSRNMLMKLKWKWAQDTLLSPSSHQRQIYGRFNVLCTSFNAAEAVRIQPPLRIFDSAASGGSGGDAELSLWQAVPLQVSQSLTKQRWSRTSPECSATEHSGESRAWVISVFSQLRVWVSWLWEWGHGTGTPAFPLSSVGPWGSLTSVCCLTQRQAAAPSHYTP